MQDRGDTCASSCSRSAAAGPPGQDSKICMLCRGDLAQVSRPPPSVGSIRGISLPQYDSINRGVAVLGVLLLWARLGAFAGACGSFGCWMRIALSTILAENLEIGIQSRASLDSAADPTSLPHFATLVLLLHTVPANPTRLPLLLPSDRLFLSFSAACILAFFHSFTQSTKQSASSAALAT